MLLNFQGSEKLVKFVDSFIRNITLEIIAGAALDVAVSKRILTLLRPPDNTNGSYVALLKYIDKMS